MTHSTLRICLTLAALGSVCGCSTATTSNTARTAREQWLISNAIDQTLSKVDFASLAGSNVYLEEKYFDSVDKSYVVGSMRHHILQTGARLVATPEEADVILEARSGGIGTDMSEKFIGIPEITLPGMLTLPEVRVAENKAQQGYAKIGLVAIDARTRQMLGSGGVASAGSDDSNWFVMGVGPFQRGSIRKELNVADQRPMGMGRRAVPRTVAFGPRSGSAPTGVADPEFQFASERQEQTTAPDAAQQ